MHCYTFSAFLVLQSKYSRGQQAASQPLLDTAKQPSLSFGRENPTYLCHWQLEPMDLSLAVQRQGVTGALRWTESSQTRVCSEILGSLRILRYWGNSEDHPALKYLHKWQQDLKKCKQSGWQWSSRRVESYNATGRVAFQKWVAF